MGADRALQKLALKIQNDPNSKFHTLSAEQQSNALSLLTGFMDKVGAKRDIDPVTGTADFAKYREKQESGWRGAVGPLIKPAAMTMMAMGGAHALGFGGSAAGGSTAGGGAAKTALFSTPAVPAGSPTLLGGTTMASTPAMTTFSGASGALGATAVPTATLTTAEFAGGTLAAGAASADLGTKAATTAKSGTVAKAGIFGTGVSATDAAMGISALSSLAAPRMPEMGGPIDPPSRDDLDMPKNRTEQMKLREDARGRQARAAGAQRSGNSADMLGGKYGPKRRGQARAALYGVR